VTTRSIGSNALALAGSRFISATGAITASVIAARSLGPSGFGSFVAIIALAFVANIVVTFGTDTLVVREVAVDPATEEIGESIGLQLAIALPLILATAVAVTLGASGALMIAAAGLLPGIWSTTSLAILRGRERMELAAVANIVGAAVAVGGAAIAAANEAEVAGFIATSVCGLTSTAMVAVALTRRLVSTSWRPSLSTWTWRRAAPFASMVAATAVASSSGVLALEVFGAEDATGHFGAANRISEGMRLLPAAFFGAAFPAMTRSVHLTETYSRTIVRITVATAVLITIVALVAEPMVDTMYGDFDGSVRPLRLLSIGLLPLLFRLKWSFELIAHGDEKAAANASIVAAGVTVVLATTAALVGGPTLVATASVVGIGVHASVLGLKRRKNAGVAGASAQQR